jgi:hypothetical protein
VDVIPTSFLANDSLPVRWRDEELDVLGRAPSAAARLRRQREPEAAGTRAPGGAQGRESGNR